MKINEKIIFITTVFTRINSFFVLAILFFGQMYELFLKRGIPEYIRSDNGPESTAKAVRDWLADIGVSSLYIEPGIPWRNGNVESFIGKLRDELFNGENFRYWR